MYQSSPIDFETTVQSKPHSVSIYGINQDNYLTNNSNILLIQAVILINPYCTDVHCGC